MKTRIWKYAAVVAILLGSMLSSGCSNKNYQFGQIELDSMTDAKRLIIQGTVWSADTVPVYLSGIRVDIYGVRDETEPDALGYNYAYTDASGHYTICRYLKRDIASMQIIGIASDPARVYAPCEACWSIESFEEIYWSLLDENDDIIHVSMDYSLTKK